MNCINCNVKSCHSLEACKVQNAEIERVKGVYRSEEVQQVVQAAEEIVGNGKAGSLSRLNELIEFMQLMNYNKVGLAYCYGMETEAALFVSILKSNGIKIAASVSCTVGGISQDAINSGSCNHNVSCNPIAQAYQLNAEGVDFTITMGLCLGHDILFNSHIKSHISNFIVKDRVNNHNPVKALKNN